MLPGVQELGIAIALELGPTPVTRLGIRGERSVRCASSKAVSASEALQSDLEGTQTTIGTEAFAAAPFRVRQIFQHGPVENLDFETVEYLLRASPPAPAIAAAPRSQLRAHAGR